MHLRSNISISMIVVLWSYLVSSSCISHQNECKYKQKKKLISWSLSSLQSVETQSQYTYIEQHNFYPSVWSLVAANRWLSSAILISQICHIVDGWIIVLMSLSKQWDKIDVLSYKNNVLYYENKITRLNF